MSHYFSEFFDGREEPRGLVPRTHLARLSLVFAASYLRLANSSSHSSTAAMYRASSRRARALGIFEVSGLAGLLGLATINGTVS